MKYAILKVSNGNYFVEAEGITNLANAKMNFHRVCMGLWNAPDVITAEVMIVDEQLDCVEGYREFIHHDPTPSVELEPEAEG